MRKAEYSALEIANWFLLRVDRDAGEAMTHLKLQKLIYYAQAWHLANFDKPLVAEEFQAWSHGPACPEVWHKYKGHGWEALDAPKAAPSVKPATEKFLRLVWATYGDESAKSLERLTHSEAPWRDARGGLPPEARCTNIIPQEVMRDYYGARLDERRTRNIKN